MRPHMPRLELKPDDLRWIAAGNLINGDDTARLRPVEGTVGQDRAVQALRTGLELRSRGFNVFVAGPDGTGRVTTVKAIIEQVRKKACPVLRDRCYVHNFKDPDRPVLLTFPVGKGRKFREGLDVLITRLRADLPTLLESEDFKRTITSVIEKYRTREAQILDGFEQKIRKQGFAFAQMKMGGVTIPDLLPLVKGKAVPIEKLEELVGAGEVTAQEAEVITSAYGKLHGEFEQVLRAARDVAREMQKQLSQAERDACGRVVRGYVTDLKDEFTDPKVRAYLDSVYDSLLDNLQLFKPEPAVQVPEPFGGMVGSTPAKTDPFLFYRVNVIHDASGRGDCPVEMPESITYATLFGAIEMDIFRSGAMHTDFTRIKGGAFLRSDGGYLVLEAIDVLRDPLAYPALKRVLKTGRLEIELPEGPIITPALAMKPEPIEVDVKVVLVGHPRLYDLLWSLDEEFASIFKVKAEFDHEMPNTPENRKHYLRVLAKIGREEKLPAMAADAAAAIVEHGARLAGRRTHLSSRFDDVADLYREAAHLSTRAGRAKIAAEDIDGAIKALRYRHNLPEEKIHELITTGVIRVAVDGAVVGQVNGLAVYDLGMVAFGKPARISATVSHGMAGVVNIEREAGLSGKIHDKGVLILTAFLRQRYGQDHPLTLTASLCFEQSYSGVEGDSASSTELYALLSALSGIPIRQAIAVTGSVDQAGHIQPIGGVNEKVEGFYDVCRVKGLTGRQGVIIPRTNVDDLMLRQDVVEAVAANKFHVWAIETADEGIELLTGKKAADVNRKVKARLKALAKKK